MPWPWQRSTANSLSLHHHPKAEALINDGTTLVLFALALQVAGGHELALGTASGMFFFSFLIGTLVGLAVGWGANKLRAHIGNPMNFSVFMFTIPFIAFFLSEEDRAFEGMKGSRSGSCGGRPPST